MLPWGPHPCQLYPWGPHPCHLYLWGHHPCELYPWGPHPCHLYLWGPHPCEFYPWGPHPCGPSPEGPLGWGHHFPPPLLGQLRAGGLLPGETDMAGVVEATLSQTQWLVVGPWRVGAELAAGHLSPTEAKSPPWASLGEEASVLGVQASLPVVEAGHLGQAQVQAQAKVLARTQVLPWDRPQGRHRLQLQPHLQPWHRFSPRCRPRCKFSCAPKCRLRREGRRLRWLLGSAE